MSHRPSSMKPSSAEIKVALTVHDEKQAAALQDFVQSLSIERARAAIKSLAKARKNDEKLLKKAA